jgi:hypothetical protein
MGEQWGREGCNGGRAMGERRTREPLEGRCKERDPRFF